MSIVLLIRSLDIGGAERQVVTFAKALHARGIVVQVLTFYPGGALRGELEAFGVPVSDLQKAGRWDIFPFFGRLWCWLRRERPSVLYSFLTTANIVGLVAGWFAGIRRIVWGVRVSQMDLTQYDWLARGEAVLSRWLSGFPDYIICNSHHGKRSHAAKGYPGAKLIVIENGIDTNRFVFNAMSREGMRTQWGVQEDDFLIGLAARLDPMKDHATFLHAASMFIQTEPKARFVCVGQGPLATELRSFATSLGLEKHIIWAGPQHNMTAALSAFDIAVSSSAFGEGFSNAIAEAMACARPCVVTDVGDAALIVGKTGWVVPARDPHALVQVWREAVQTSRETLRQRGVAARARIDAEFSVERMVTRTLETLSP